MSEDFFPGVLDCSRDNGGVHPFGEPTAFTLPLTGTTSWTVECGGCGVGVSGASAAEAMANAQRFDSLNREGRFG